MNAPYITSRFCGRCKRSTKQECIDGEHERDSSDCSQECLECGWHWNHFFGKWEPPHGPARKLPPGGTR